MLNFPKAVRPLPDFMIQRRDILTADAVHKIKRACEAAEVILGDSLDDYVEALVVGDEEAADRADSYMPRYARGLIVTLEMEAGLIPMS